MNADKRFEITAQITHALVRPPSPSFVHAISPRPQPIDVALAQKQHAEYVAALRAAGVDVEILEPDEQFPDSCFMQDPAMVILGIAILNRMASASRVGETELIAKWLAEHFETRRIFPPATLEGGDVVNLGDRLLVGESGRTNTAGVEQLRELVAPRGLRVSSIRVPDHLHLSTVMTYVGQGNLVVHQDYADESELEKFTKIRVPRAEEYVSNVLAIANRIILPAGYPHTEGQLRALGYELLPVPMSEFEKADGGVTCLSLVW